MLDFAVPREPDAPKLHHTATKLGYGFTARTIYWFAELAELTNAGIPSRDAASVASTLPFRQLADLVQDLRLEHKPSESATPLDVMQDVVFHAALDILMYHERIERLRELASPQDRV